ncbi:MAG: lipopolysaccharide transport system permease protein [Acidimicrobiaceae bacterium]|nr:lipopolysaccharide transport system permease protein [Acidimicrobiaceae bacterium]
MTQEFNPSDRGQTFHLLIRPTGGWRSLDLREVWRYRGLLGAMTRRDITLRYRQTALGVIWVVLQPLLAAGIFTFVFGSIAKFSSDGVPYVIFAYTGLLGYNAFSNSLASMSTCLVANGALVSKVYFPRLILPLSQIGSKLVDFGVAFALYLILNVTFHVGFHLSLLTLPAWMLLAYGSALGLGLLTSALNVSYRDVGFIVPVALPLLLYLAPVAYGTQVVPKRLRGAYGINPLVGIINGFRWCLLGRGSLSAGSTIYAAVFTVVVVVLGVLYFRSHERRFPDVI